jgi:hypothetical protein
MGNRNALIFLIILSFLVPAVGGCTLEPKNLPPEEKEGYELYRVYCRQCHSLQSPKLHTRERWPATVDKMQKFMKRKSEKVKVIDDAQKEKILLFLKRRARR